MAEENKVLGIRLDIEERKKFDKFVIEEGKGNKDFLSTLLNLYELNKGKVKNINLVGDIETLEGYTNKIHQAFISIIDKLENQKDNISENSNKDLQIYKDKVNNLMTENDGINSINSMNNEKLTAVNNDNLTLKEQNNQLQGSLKDKLTIIDEYKTKNDMLLSQIIQYKKLPEQLETIKGLLADSQAKNIDLNNINKNNDLTVVTMVKDAEKSKTEYEKSFAELKVKHIADIKSLNKENELNIKLEAASIKEKLNNKFNLEIEKHNSEVEKHNSEIEVYQSKYKDLLEQMQKEKPIKKNVESTQNK